jgi:hypothetical protein
MRRTAFAVVLIVSTASLAIAAAVWPPFFLGAAAGNAVPFEYVVLPPPSPAPQVGDLPLFQRLAPRSPFSPRLQQLLEGETLVTSEKQMREVWDRLFAVPYDAAQFDFESSFVVLMGGGAIANGSFDISAVEQVEASYANPGGFDGDATETFLSVTATTFQSGVLPDDPPPPTWRLSAVKVARALLDDVVFRRNLAQGV